LVFWVIGGDTLIDGVVVCLPELDLFYREDAIHRLGDSKRSIIRQAVTGKEQARLKGFNAILLAGHYNFLNSTINDRRSISRLASAVKKK
jgi:hypothetical protein